jgi:hypothetical protein
MFQKGADWKPSSSTGTRTMYGSIAYVEDNYRNRKQMLSDETDSCVRTISVKKSRNQLCKYVFFCQTSQDCGGLTAATITPTNE